MGIGVRIRDAMEAVGKRPIDIAKHLKITDAAVSQWFAKDKGPRTNRLPMLAAFLSTTVEWLVSGEGMQQSRNDDHSGSKKLASARQAVDTELSTLPLWFSAEGDGQTGAWLVNRAKTIGRVPRVDPLNDLENAGSAQLKSNDMEPAYWRGDTLYLNPSQTVNPGHDCLFARPAGNGTHAVLCRRLLKISPTHWRVRQYNPKRDYNLSREEWPGVWLIEGKINKR